MIETYYNTFIIINYMSHTATLFPAILFSNIINIYNVIYDFVFTNKIFVLLSMLVIYKVHQLALEILLTSLNFTK